MEQKKKTNIIIIVLAVLLGVSLLALGGTLIRSNIAGNTQTTVTVPDNLITPDEEISKPGSIDSSSRASGSSDAKNPESSVLQMLSSAATSSATVYPVQNTTSEKNNAETIKLYNKQPEDNITFNVGNMFPGDSETKNFRVQVSYSETVTVHYKATVRKGYEKLAEVLKVKVKLLTTGDTLYDGLIRDMPESLTHKLASEKSTTDELYYEITAYLDTSVGNEYQNKDLIADFSWWVEETGSLEPTPKTGDSLNMLLWVCLAAASGSVIIFLLFAHKRREEV